MVGALVFLGCPWRAFLRLAGGDANAIGGIAGLVAGIWVGILFIKAGYNLGRSQQTYASAGLIMPIIMLGLLGIYFIQPLSTGAPFFSTEGPGSMHASLLLSLEAGLVIGFFAQRTRFCTIGAVRDVILVRDFHLLSGVFGLLAGAFLCNLLLGQFNPGMAGQPIAHTDFLWNFLGMSLSGLAFTLAGGCPGRQLFMSGEGDGDAAVFVLGLIAGAAFAHNFGVAASPKGIGEMSALFVTIGLIVCIGIGLSMRKKI
jgi:YedE family putative selenium metabolism protein